MAASAHTATGAPRSALVLALAAQLLLVSHPVGATEDPVVRLATLDWAPYVGSDLPGEGWISEVVRAAFARQGYRVELTWLPWSRGLMESADGRYDGLMPMYDGPGRRDSYLLSSPLPAAQVGLWTRADQALAWDGQDIAPLQGLRVGVVQGYVNHPAIDASDAHLELDQARNDRLNMAKLAAGRVDVIVIDFLVARHLQAEDPSLDRLVPVSPAFELRPTYVGFSRHTARSAELVSAFDAGLAALIEDGDLAEILTRAGVIDLVTLPGAGASPPAAPKATAQ